MLIPAWRLWIKAADQSELTSPAGPENHVCFSMTLVAGAPRREAEGSIGRRPRLSDCRWAARASSEPAALRGPASGGELDLKSASVSYSCGGKTPSWRAICLPASVSLIRKGETCHTNLGRMLTSIFFH